MIKNIIYVFCLIFLLGCGTKTVSSDNQLSKFLGTWEQKETITWMLTQPRIAVSKLKISPIKNSRDQAMIDYLSDGLGICEVVGIATISDNTLVFDSWKPESNKDNNPNILNQDSSCVMNIIQKNEQQIQINVINKACYQACGVHGELAKILPKVE